MVRLFNVPIVYSVGDVNIGVMMSHTYRGDLRMFLTSPGGTQVTLIQNTADTQNNFNVLYDDSAAAAITTHTTLNDTATAATVVPPYQRTFRPLQPLTAFNGQNANGSWTLSICDSLNADSGTFFHSTLVITPQPATLNAAKVSNVVTDNISVSNPKALPGATIRYCITISNAGPGIAATINANDALPPHLTYVPGTLVSGADCATAATAEDDNAAGADETDLMGASFSAGTVTITRPSMLSGTSFSVVLNATVN
ncbi:MAG: proprotein convertase P-domain-containing protein [Sphingorhabdus sp.]